MWVAMYIDRLASRLEVAIALKPPDVSMFPLFRFLSVTLRYTIPTAYESQPSLKYLPHLRTRPLPRAASDWDGPLASTAYSWSESAADYVPKL